MKLVAAFSVRFHEDYFFRLPDFSISCISLPLEELARHWMSLSSVVVASSHSGDLVDRLSFKAELSDSLVAPQEHSYPFRDFSF